jgi:hypothetical protein
MGRQINFEAPLSEEDKAYLRERGRGYLIPANERRFGVDGTRVPEEHETVGAPAQTPFYTHPDQQTAVYDKGGAPLPGTVLDYDTGRVADRENGVTVEYSGPGHTPGAYDPAADNYGFDSSSDDGDDIDQDIVEFVAGQKNKSELQKLLSEAGVDFETDANRDRLEDLLAINLQDRRDAGEDLKL